MTNDTVHLCRSIFLRESDFKKIKNKAKRENLYDTMSWAPIDITYVETQCMLMLFSDPTLKCKHSTIVLDWVDFYQQKVFFCASKERIDLISLVDFYLCQNKHKLFRTSFQKYLFDIEDNYITIRYRRSTSSNVLGIGVFEKVLPKVKHSRLK